MKPSRNAACALLALAGCIPIQSVVGRPASVMAEGEERGSFGIGGVWFEREDADERDLSAGIFFPYLSYAQGVGRGFDFEVGGWFVGADSGDGAGHLCFLLRRQILGEPYVMEAENQLRTRPLDLSIEAGASVSGVSNAEGWADAHLGLNASVPLPWGATPYVSYRYHWGAFDRPFEVQMLFVGVEFTRADWGRVCAEIFHGYPPDYDRGSIWRTWGCNLLYRTKEF